MQITATLDYGPLNVEVSSDEREEVQQTLLDIVEFLRENVTRLKKSISNQVRGRVRLNLIHLSGQAMTLKNRLRMVLLSQGSVKKSAYLLNLLRRSSMLIPRERSVLS